MRKSFKQFLQEDTISPSKESNLMDFWHGGNLEIEQKKVKRGRTEYGPGLYLITDYYRAKEYSQGSRKLYFITAEKGTDITTVDLPLKIVNDFINKYVSVQLRKEIIARLEKISENGSVKASRFLITLINYDAVKPSYQNILRTFLVDNGIDYWMVDNPFGNHERMMVLYNMNKLHSKRIVNPKDKIEIFDLPKKF